MLELTVTDMFYKKIAIVINNLSVLLLLLVLIVLHRNQELQVNRAN